MSTYGPQARDRARAALAGLAIGDALGMPTQLMSPAEVAERFGVLDGFHPGGPDHPIAAGMPAGSVTDDTEQALVLARLMIDGGGHVEPKEFAARLVAWEDDMRSRGSLDLLGPSTRRAVAAVMAGVDVSEAGRAGATNGAAMRIAPLGIAVGSADLGALVDRVVEASSVTHHTGLAIASASAVAAAVSAGIGGADVASVIPLAVEAAALGAARGSWVAGGDVARRIRWAVDLVQRARPEEALRDVRE
uniref:ADP-ribosylglycohydrolase family protein n=1 Tax=Actinotalea sp. TaxID=1872145 RepID=UPI0035670B9F